MKSIDSPVYFQESAANGVYFLKEGKVRISKYNKEGLEFLIAIIGSGEIFGESAVTGKTIRKEEAIAEENTIVCMMKEDKMKEFLLLVPEFNLKFSRMIEERLEKTQKRLEDLTFKTNPERIIDFLKESVLKTEANKKGVFVISHSLTQENIAKLTSTNRQLVSTILSDLKKQNIIDYNRKEIIVLNNEKLQTC